MANGEINFDEMRAPEVVRPLSLKQEKPPRVSTPPPPLKQPPPPPIPRAAARPPSPPAATQTSQKQKPTSIAPKPPETNNAWVGILVVAGIILLICFMVGISSSQNGETPRNNTSAPSDQVRVPEQSIIQHIPETVTTVFPETPKAPIPTQVVPDIPKTTGSCRISAFAVAGNGERHSVTGNAVIAFRHVDTSAAISTNVMIPRIWHDMPAGEYHFAIFISGFTQSFTNKINITADDYNNVAFSLQPLPARVTFVCPSNSLPFAIFDDHGYLGSSDKSFELSPYLTHFLTFKAEGWRDKPMKVKLEKPGGAYRCAVEMERIASGLRITVSANKGEPPVAGALIVNGGEPVKVAFPSEQSNLAFAGPLSLVLAVDGYQVINNTQQVTLIDREMVNIEFQVVKKSWLSRMLNGSARKQIQK
ncbi:MAG: hypothetical protein WCI20_00150 [bacterium]